MQLRALLEPLLRRDQLDQCMEEEMRFHIEERAADLHRSGLAPDEAKRKAQIEFGGTTPIRSWSCCTDYTATAPPSVWSRTTRASHSMPNAPSICSTDESSLSQLKQSMQDRLDVQDAAVI